MTTGIYIGSDPNLRGKRAILFKQDHATVRAQFDDLSLPQAFGWHIFPEANFELEPDEED